VSGEWSEEAEQELGSDITGAMAAALSAVRDWELAPSQQHVEAVKRAYRQMGRAARNAEGPGADALWAVAACCACVVRTAWWYWVSKASDYARDLIPVGVGRGAGRVRLPSDRPES